MIPISLVLAGSLALTYRILSERTAGTCGDESVPGTAGAVVSIVTRYTRVPLTYTAHGTVMCEDPRGAGHGSTVQLPIRNCPSRERQSLIPATSALVDQKCRIPNEQPDGTLFGTRDGSPVQVTAHSIIQSVAVTHSRVFVTDQYSTLEGEALEAAPRLFWVALRDRQLQADRIVLFRKATSTAPPPSAALVRTELASRHTKVVRSHLREAGKVWVNIARSSHPELNNTLIVFVTRRSHHQVCPVCMLHSDKGSPQSCGHVFHPDCMSESLDEEAGDFICPVCSIPINPATSS